MDLACGDGTYTALLAQHAPTDVEVVGLDVSRSYLKLAKETVQEAEVEQNVSLMKGDAFNLPFEDDYFDVVWCAHSMISLKPPQDVLHEMKRVTRPGGLVVVVENDELHSLILPWRAEVELVVHQALQKALSEEGRTLEERCFARSGREAMTQAGLNYLRTTIYPTRLDAPLEQVEEECLRAYLARAWDQVKPHLSETNHAEVQRFLSPAQNHEFLQSERLEATWLDFLMVAESPSSSTSRG